MIREPVVAGQFYPANPDQLRKSIRAFVKESAPPTEAKAIVSPHAGYIYSGSVAGRAYSAVNLPKRIAILGPNHTGRGKALSLYPCGQWNTPLGPAGIDEGLNRSLLQECSLLAEDSAAHAGEHSIEVQIPFLQVLAGAFAFSAICVGTADYSSLEALGHALARAVKSSPDPVLIVVSSDMNHFESAATSSRKDRSAIEKMEAIDARGLYETVIENDVSMCGFAPAVAMLIACRDLGASRGRLIHYANSGDVSGDFDRVVGYAALAVV